MNLVHPNDEWRYHKWWISIIDFSGDIFTGSLITLYPHYHSSQVLVNSIGTPFLTWKTEPIPSQKQVIKSGNILSPSVTMPHSRLAELSIIPANRMKTVQTVQIVTLFISKPLPPLSSLHHYSWATRQVISWALYTPHWATYTQLRIYKHLKKRFTSIWQGDL